MNRALGLRRRDWFGRTPSGGIIDDRGEWPGHISLNVPQDAGEPFEVGRDVTPIFHPVMGRILC